MAHIKDHNFVDILPISLKVPPNPLLGYDENKTALPSTATSEPGLSQRTLKHRVLLYDQRCLVTGAVSNQLQTCYLISPIHVGGSNQEKKLHQKKEVVWPTIFDTLGGGKSPCYLGTVPHPATVWDWGLFLKQLTKLYC